MKGFAVFLLLLLHAITISSSAAAGLEDRQSAAVNETASKEFKTTFVSLSPGHAIASSSFIFSGKDSFEIKTPGEDYREASGGYTGNSIFFDARFEADILKQNKHYRYAFSAKGIFLGDYIAGTVVLEESIKETKQNQKVTFVFTGTSRQTSPTDKKRESFFPF